MKLKKKIFHPVVIIIFSWLLLITSSCGRLFSENQIEGQWQLFYQNVQIFVDQVIESARGNVPPLSQTVLPTLTPQQLITQLPTQSSILLSSRCNAAGAGFPLDLTIPDNTRILPGQSFSKTWRLVNRGTCTWTRDYSLVWFSGSILGALPNQAIISQVSPGQTFELTVDFSAPESPGVYTGYWMLKSPDGALFGLGPEGSAPLWVRIQVVADVIRTPTLETTALSLIGVISEGRAELRVNQHFDLDSGEGYLGDENDIGLIIEKEDYFLLIPQNGTLIGRYSGDSPSEQDCRLSSVNSNPLQLTGLIVGEYICYLTSDAHSGVIRLIQMPSQEQPLIFEYTTWVIP